MLLDSESINDTVTTSQYFSTNLLTCDQNEFRWLNNFSTYQRTNQAISHSTNEIENHLETH